MTAVRFISSKLSFKGKAAVVSIAVSFVVMILALAISSGFRREIRRSLSEISGDVRLTSSRQDFLSDEYPIKSEPSYISKIREIDGVEAITPVVYRAGIVKKGNEIQGVLFKGTPHRDTLGENGVSIPSRLAEILELKPGDKFTSYFVGERPKARAYTIKEIYPSLVQADRNLLVNVAIEGLQKLNGWNENQVSALEITLSDEYRQAADSDRKCAEIGSIAMMYESEEDDTLIASSLRDRYPQLFEWLHLIDFNVLVILLLMTVVAGFNMISGLLIMLFRSISTIGTLKAMGMTDRAIGKVFLRIASGVVLKAMLIGNGLALFLCFLQSFTHILKLNPAHYFVSFVPVHIDLPFILAADAAAYFVIMLLLYIPTVFISKVDPARTIRTK